MRQIKSLLLFHSIEIPFSSTQQWTGPFIKWLHDIELGNEYPNRSFKVLVDLFDYLSAEKNRLNHEVIELAREEKYIQRVKLLRTIPDIGCVSAMEILVELQDISQVKTAGELAAYFGLTSSQYSSGEYIRVGHLIIIRLWRANAISVNEAIYPKPRTDPTSFTFYKSHY